MKPCGQTVLRELFGMAEAVPGLSAALAGKAERIQRDRLIARLGGLFGQAARAALAAARIV